MQSRRGKFVHLFHFLPSNEVHFRNIAGSPEEGRLFYAVQ